MNFLTVVLAMVLGAETVAENSASVVLTAEPSQVESGALTPGSFALKFQEANVAQGSYSGISVTFTTDEPRNSHHKLTLFIPSHEGFSVDYSSSEGKFSLVTVTPPFTVQAKQSEGIVDRFRRPRPMTVNLAHWLQIGKQHWSETSIVFTDCLIDVESMSITGKSLVFSGRIECKSEEPPYSASGAFSVNGGELGVSKVD